MRQSCTGADKSGEIGLNSPRCNLAIQADRFPDSLRKRQLLKISYHLLERAGVEAIAGRNANGIRTTDGGFGDNLPNRSKDIVGGMDGVGDVRQQRPVPGRHGRPHEDIRDIGCILETAARGEGDLVGLAQSRCLYGTGYGRGLSIIPADTENDIGSEAQTGELVVLPIDPRDFLVGLLEDAVEIRRRVRLSTRLGRDRTGVDDPIDAVLARRLENIDVDIEY